MDNHNDNPTRGLALALSTGVFLCVAGCSQPPVDDEPDTGTSPTADVPTQPTTTWEVTTVAEDDVGLHLRFDVAGDQLGLTYYGMSGTESGDCDEIGDEPPAKIEWELHYAFSDGESWTTETIARSPFVGQPSGLDFRFDADGVPHVAAMTGEPVEQIRYCGVNDVGLFRRTDSGWTTETAVATSGEASSGFEPSDYGEVVGYWPALAFDEESRPAIVYKDVHAGGMQSDDFKRADLEVATRDSGWSAAPLDYGNGAGDYNDATFDDRGRLIVVTVNPVEATSEEEQGVWVYRSTEDGTDWTRQRLHNSGTVNGPSIALSEEGLHVVFYDAGYGYPRLATLPSGATLDDIESWTFEDIGDSRFDEGYETSLAVTPDGRLAISYYRCGRSNAGLGNCDTANDGLIFAWRDADTWEREIVDVADNGYCGRGPRLAFADDGAPIIAYRCERNTEDGLVSEVRVAQRGGSP